MKKLVIKFLAIITIAVLILVVTVTITKIGNNEIAVGIYKITGFEEYPEAYIEVKDSSIQFYNIDLNKIYQTEQQKLYERYIERCPEYALDEDEFAGYSDLNNLFVDNSYFIDYEVFDDTKSGTFEYTYFLYPGDNNICFGLVIIYDSFHKTIHINNEIKEITFKK